MSRPRVIILEDDEGLRDLMSEILESEGVEVAGFSEGIPALEHMKKMWLPDILIVDLKLPDIGPDVLKEDLSKIPGGDKVSLIVASGNSKIEEWAQKLNAVTVLKKPYDIDSFTMTILAVIDSRN